MENATGVFRSVSITSSISSNGESAPVVQTCCDRDMRPSSVKSVTGFGIPSVPEMRPISMPDALSSPTFGFSNGESAMARAPDTTEPLVATFLMTISSPSWAS